MSRNTLGTYLIQLRQARGVSPTRLARLAQVSRATLYNWESGRFEPRLPELEAVLCALGVSAQEREAALNRFAAPRAQKQLRTSDDLSSYLPQGGELLRALRLRANRTQAQVSTPLQVSQTTIGRWESGDSWPAQELLHCYCSLLRARDEEIAVLMRGPFPFSQDSGFAADITLAAIEARLLAVQQRLRSPSCYALGDLLYLSLQAQAFILARKSAEAHLLLAKILLHRAAYLGERCQPAEAGRVGEQALRLLPRGDQWNHLRLTGEMFKTVWKYPMHLHERKLRHWLECPLPLSERVWVMGQIAASLLEKGANDLALQIDRQALSLVEETGDITAIQHRRNMYAESLLTAGRAAEAAELLTVTESMSPPLRLRTKLTLSEAYLAAGNHARAQDWLHSACNDNRVLNISYYLPDMEALARKL